MILARCCSKTVLEEQTEIIRQSGSVFWPRNLCRLTQAWTSYIRVELKLSLYELYISFRRFVGFSSLPEL